MNLAVLHLIVHCMWGYPVGKDICTNMSNVCLICMHRGSTTVTP